MKNLYVFADYFFPAKYAGGPLKTLKCFVKSMKDDFNLIIVTRGYDINSTNYFDNTKLNCLIRVDGFSVMYLSRGLMGWYHMFKILRNGNGIFYFNSFFSFRFTIIPIFLLIKVLKKSSKVVLSPRGELSKAALSIKTFRKKVYLMFAQISKLLNSVNFLVTSESEKNDVVSSDLIISGSMITVLPNLVDEYIDVSSKIETSQLNSDCDTIRFVTLSRITPIKNIEFSLLVLSKLPSKVVFDIYGPIEDYGYHSSLLKMCSSFPDNLSVNFRGFLNTDDVNSVLSRYDLFLFPSHSENFGHVIIESIQSGTPVLLSNNTPFLEDVIPVIKVLPLVESTWVDYFNYYLSLSSAQRREIKEACLLFSRKIGEREITNRKNYIEYFYHVA